MRMRPFVAMLAALAALAVGLGTITSAAAPPPGSEPTWFSEDRAEPTSGRSREVVAPADTVVRTRFTAFDATEAAAQVVPPSARMFAMAGQRTLVPSSTAAVQLELFDGNTMRFEPLEVAMRRSSDGSGDVAVEWLGVTRTDGAIMAQLSLAFIPGAKGAMSAAGSVMTNDGQILISRTQGDTYQLDQLTETSDLPEGDDTATPPPAGKAVAAAPDPALAGAAAAGATANIDVIVAYANGNPSDIVSRIAAKVAATNTTLATSQVNARLNLLSTMYVNYNQDSSALGNDLSYLAAGTNGLAGVKAARDQQNADLVALVVPNHRPDACGVGYIPSAGGNPNAAFQVSANDCFDGDSHVMTHEWGHNLGGDHNPEATGGTPYAPYPYSHGKATNGVARTIMAYNNICTIACPRKLQFSNPNVDYIGVPGISSGDTTTRNNALSLNNIAPYVEGYRISGSRVQLRTTATAGPPQRDFLYGVSAYKHLLCDFDGDGIDGIVAFGDNGNWYIRSTATAGPPEQTVAFGATGYIPVCGDWDGVGGDGIGVYVAGTWYLRQTASPGSPQLTFSYGASGYTPVVGDWDGHAPLTHGRDGIGVYWGSGNWNLRQTASPGSPDISFVYGASYYTPVVGDWDNDILDRDGVGVWGDNGNWYLRQTASGGSAEVQYAYGYTGVRPLPGDYDGDGKDGSGIVIP